MQSAARPLYEHIRTAVEREFAPTFMVIENESHRHSSGKGEESHFKVLVVSEKFAGQSIIDRHRAVNAAVYIDGKLPVHALSIKALPPAQFERDRDTVLAGFTTPPCLGGEAKRKH